jgi:single-strand DNA-binding protein
VDGETNWFTVSSFRALATNAAGSVVKGDRVVVSGRLRVRDWKNTDRSGTNVEIEADALGHDLSWGTSVYTRHVSVAATSSWDDTGAVSLATENSADSDSEFAADSDSEFAAEADGEPSAESEENSVARGGSSKSARRETVAA